MSDPRLFVLADQPAAEVILRQLDAADRASGWVRVNTNDSATVERVARAMYDSACEKNYRDAEWAWPFIDIMYDRDDEEDDNPHWLSDSFRADARAVLAALRGDGGNR